MSFVLLLFLYSPTLNVNKYATKIKPTEPFRGNLNECCVSALSHVLQIANVPFSCKFLHFDISRTVPQVPVEVKHHTELLVSLHQLLHLLVTKKVSQEICDDKAWATASYQCIRAPLSMIQLRQVS